MNELLKELKAKYELFSFLGGFEVESKENKEAYYNFQSCVDPLFETIVECVDSGLNLRAVIGSNEIPIGKLSGLENTDTLRFAKEKTDRFTFEKLALHEVEEFRY